MRAFRVFALALATVFTFSAVAADNKAAQKKPLSKAAYKQPLRQVSDRTTIYGYNYMTGHDRDLYHQRLREAKTAQERNAFLAEHRLQMQARAKAYGVTLPDAPVPGKAGSK